MNKPLVFISYSHQDAMWKDRLLHHLRVLSANQIEGFDDRRIAAGADWHADIMKALETARVALLLVSAQYLSSKFVLDTEIPTLLRRQERGRLRIIPVILKPCAWQEVSWLAKIQVWPTHGRALSTLKRDRRELELAQLARQVLQEIEPIREPGWTSVEGEVPPLSVGRISLKNVRGFRDIELDLSGSLGARARTRTLIIGRNGTCKSTLLRAIAMSLCDPVDAGALIAEPIGTLVGLGSEVAEIEVQLTARAEPPRTFLLRKEIQNADGKDSIRDIGSQHPPREPFVCAYGAGRFGIGTDTGRSYRIRDSVASLFDYRQTLIDSELTLRRLSDFLGTGLFQRTLLGIKRVLGLSEEDEIHLAKGGGVEVSGPTIGSRVRLEGWADGYRLTLAWLLDLYGWAMRADRITADGGIDGILLIDEIEQHLHPSMQTGILPRLSEILPDLQIIATSHSPLVALGVAPEDLVSLRRESDGSVVAEPAVPDFSSYSAEDMLIDERLFDTEVYAPDTNNKLARYRDLVKIPPARRDGEQIKELQVLALELRSQQVPEVRQSAAAEELKRLIAKHNL